MQVLLFYVDGEPTDADSDVIERSYATLLATRGWSAVPQFIDDGDEETDRTVGVALELSEPGADAASEWRQLADVEALIEWACAVTRDSELEICVEYSNELIGSFAEGVESGLSAGLITPWRAALSERRDEARNG